MDEVKKDGEKSSEPIRDLPRGTIESKIYIEPLKCKILTMFDARGIKLAATYHFQPFLQSVTRGFHSLRRFIHEELYRNDYIKISENTSNSSRQKSAFTTQASSIN